METIPVLFVPDSWNELSPPISRFTQILNVHTTYEEIIEMLLQRGSTRPLNPPPSWDLLYKSKTYKTETYKTETYRVLLGAYNRLVKKYAKLTGYMQAGDTLLSVGLISTETVFLACKGFITQGFIKGGYAYSSSSQLDYPQRGMYELLYQSDEGKVIVQEIAASLAKQNPTSTSPSLIDEAITALTSREVTAIVNVITIATPLIGTLIFVAKQWAKKQGAGSTSAQVGSQPPESEIVAIRLLMNHGPEEKIPSEWLTDPEKLKHWINVLNDPSSGVKPLQAIFVMRNGTKVFADVSEDAQSSLQLNELLSILNIDAPEK